MTPRELLIEIVKELPDEALGCALNELVEIRNEFANKKQPAELSAQGDV